MELIYNGTDITEDVRILRAEYECFLGEHADRLKVVIDSSDEATSGWGFAPGDTVKLKDPDSGKMTVYRTDGSDNETTIYAASITQPEEQKTNNWKKITFKKLVKDLASSLGYGAEFHGTEDPLYEKVEQKDVDDLSFLVHRCALEGCLVVAFDGKIKVLSESWIEKQKPTDYEFDEGTIRETRPFAKCIVTDGETKGSHSEGKGAVMTVKESTLGSIDEARRFAKNLLYHRNRNTSTCIIYEDDLLTDLYAGSIVSMTTGEWNEEKAVVYRIRYDLEAETTKLWTRRIP